MTDPFLILGVAEEATDEEVKRRYLALVRVFSPERDPERFQAIRTAFEAIRSRRGRLRQRLLHAGQAPLLRLKLSCLEGGGAASARASRDTVSAVLLEGATAAMTGKGGEF